MLIRVDGGLRDLKILKTFLLGLWTKFGMVIPEHEWKLWLKMNNGPMNELKKLASNVEAQGIFLGTP